MLFFGTRTRISPNLMSFKDQAALNKEPWEENRVRYSIQPLSTRINPEDRAAKKDEVYRVLKERLKLRFTSGDLDLDFKKVTYAHFGVTYAQRNPPVGNAVLLPNQPEPVKSIWIWLHHKAFEPFFREDLTDAERYGLIYFNACTLTHEWLVGLR